MAPRNSSVAAQSPASRKKATSVLHQTSTSSSLPPPPPPSRFAFNSSSNLFASVSSSHVGSTGKERLRVWDVSTNAVVAEWDLGPSVLGETSQSANCAVRALTWATLETSSVVESSKRLSSEAIAASQDLQEPDSENSRENKRRRKRLEKVVSKAATQNQITDLAENAEGAIEVVVVISDDQIACFLPSVATVIKRVSVSKSSTADNKVASVAWIKEHDVLAIGTTNNISIISISLGETIISLPLPRHATSPSVIAHVSAKDLTLLISNMAVTPLSISLPLSATSITNFHPQQSIAVSPLRLVVPLSEDRLLTAETDGRVASLWKVTQAGSLPLEALATIPLPTSSGVHYAAVDEQHHRVAIMSVSGEVCLFSLDLSDARSGAPEEETTPIRKKGKANKPKGLLSLKPVSIVSIVEGKESRQASIVALAFVGAKGGDEKNGELVVGRMGGGGRVVWNKVNVIDAAGNLLPTVVIKKSVMELAIPTMSDDPIPLKRFDAATATSGRTTTTAFDDDEATRLSRLQMELPVDGDLADLTLGERLAVMEGNLPTAGAVSEDDEENGQGAIVKSKQPAAPGVTQLAIQTTQSLTRLLSQALHSSDQPLLSLILTSSANSTPTLVRNTIRKMPASLALPLLKACVDRLGKGKQYDRRGGGRGGGIAPQQGRGVVAWIKGVLVERGSVLMAIPSLPIHLASLSQLLQSRLTLNQPLLALSGRLDLALAQIQMRKALASAQPSNAGRRYVEGESESDEDSDEEDDDVEIEHGEEGGEIEDVRMASGRQSREDDEDSGDEEGESAKVPASASKKKLKGKGKATGDVDVDMAAVSLSDEGDEASDSDDDDEDDDDEDDEALYDEEDDSDGGRNPFVDDEASESDGDDEDEEMEE